MAEAGDQDASLSALTGQVRALAQLHASDRQTWEDGHARLRRDYEGLSLRLEQLNHSRELMSESMALLAARPTSVSNLVMTTPQIVTVVAFCCSLVYGAVAVYGKMDHFEKQQEMQRVLITTLSKDIAKLQGRQTGLDDQGGR